MSPTRSSSGDMPKAAKFSHDALDHAFSIRFQIPKASTAAVGLAVMAPLLGPAQELQDSELALLEVKEKQLAEDLSRQIAELRERLRCHEQRRCGLRRELLRRNFASAFGQLLADCVPSFLSGPDVLRWMCASPAAASQLCHLPVAAYWPSSAKKEREMVDHILEDGPRARLHHLHSLSAHTSAVSAQAIVAGLHWPSLETLSMDLGRSSWTDLIEALWNAQSEARQMSDAGSGSFDPQVVTLCKLRGLSVTFPAERSAAAVSQWRCAAPQLLRLGQLLSVAPLQELVLTDLRSTEVLTTALAAPCSHLLRVCRASFIGPESRNHAFELPRTGLPALECLMVQYRDFRQQRTSRQERMQILADPLLACLQSIKNPEKLRVLSLSGIRVDGNQKETEALLQALKAFTGLVSVALRFSVPATFGTLIPWSELIRLRLSWSSVGYFAVGDMSLHGFDYWPEQMTDFQQLYPEGGVPKPCRVFSSEFRHVLATQYNTDVEQIWIKLGSQEQELWKEVASRLPKMVHSEVRARVAELFPSCLP
eukprot:TRINITY_DN12491_c0_g1_i2.p1 TRINITY_DN12491_c0_g1~~TRINITY_DN12491_c0_g1_i2.p1  ORF type:complete len:538 (-),score=80.04 TRINITY_DN12491_c0_g1_i2:127-1740(-)